MKILSWILLLLTSLLITAGATAQRLVQTGTIVLVPSPAAQPTTAPLPTYSNPEPAREDQSLIDLVNAYRTSHGRSVILSNGNLCRIADTRLARMVAAGGLDNHAGFATAAQGQKEFSRMSEILQYRLPPASNEAIVSGWTASHEHEVVLLAPGWTNGCGATNGSMSVFIFGMK